MKKIFPTIFIALAVLFFSANATAAWKSPKYISAIYLTNTFFQFTLSGEAGNSYRITEAEAGSLFYERCISLFSTSFYKQTLVSFDYDNTPLTGTTTYKVTTFFSGR